MIKSNKAGRIAVTFHAPINSSPEASVIFLESTVNDLFDSAGSRVNLGDQLTEEIMYSIQKPLVSSPETLEDFFKKMRRLFSRTSAYNPHFTQLPEFMKSGD